jgi:predicted dehydrogenase
MSEKVILKRQKETLKGRRLFLANSGRGAFGLRLLSAFSALRVVGANERVRLGLIGAGGRGRQVASHFTLQNVDVVAVADVYEPHLRRGLKIAGPHANGHDNYRKLLEDKTIDAVLIATPDHWHAQMTLDAVSAGKDVYVEKPLCHTIDEGFQVVEAVRKTSRVVQVGTQRRSYDVFLEAKKAMDSGPLGEVRLVNAGWYNKTTSLRAGKLEGKLDWQQWLGPAPQRPLDPLRFFNWYYFWDYSGGLMVGQAAHIIDAIHWFMNASRPVAVTCASGKVHQEGAEVPETVTACIEYPAPNDFLAIFTLGYRAMRYSPSNDHLTGFHGSKARLDVKRDSFALYPESDQVKMKPSVEFERPGTFDNATKAHVGNFLDCIKSRKEPNAPVEAGQSTNVVLCMAMEAVRTRRRICWDETARRIV